MRSIVVGIKGQIVLIGRCLEYLSKLDDDFEIVYKFEVQSLRSSRCLTFRNYLQYSSVM